MVADVLAVNMSDKQVSVFYEEEIQLSVPFNCKEMIEIQIYHNVFLK